LPLIDHPSAAADDHPSAAALVTIRRPATIHGRSTWSGRHSG
jgi:hypothetical protein